MARHKAAEKRIRKRVGAEVERRRLIAGLTRDDLARAADIDPSQMSKVLRGECGLSLYSLKRLADVFGVPVRDLASALDDEGAAEGAKQGRSDVLAHSHIVPATNGRA